MDVNHCDDNAVIVKWLQSNEQPICRGEYRYRSTGKMVVYLSGPASVFQTDEGNFTMYPSAYSFGMNFMDGDLEARQGNIFYEALMQYGEEKGITMEIHFLADLYSGEEPLDDLLQNAYENGTMPDLVLVGKHTELDYYRLREQGI